MKPVIIKVHSVTDVITNSSSEVFLAKHSNLDVDALNALMDKEVEIEDADRKQHPITDDYGITYNYFRLDGAIGKLNDFDFYSGIYSSGKDLKEGARETLYTWFCDDTDLEYGWMSEEDWNANRAFIDDVIEHPEKYEGYYIIDVEKMNDSYQPFFESLGFEILMQYEA